MQISLAQRLLMCTSNVQELLHKQLPSEIKVKRIIRFIIILSHGGIVLPFTQRSHKVWSRLMLMLWLSPHIKCEASPDLGKNFLPLLYLAEPCPLIWVGLSCSAWLLPATGTWQIHFNTEGCWLTNNSSKPRGSITDEVSSPKYIYTCWCLLCTWGNEKSSNQSLPAPSSGGRLHEVGTQQCGTWVKTKSFVFILWSAKTVSMFNQVLHTTETVQQLGVKKKKNENISSKSKCRTITIDLELGARTVNSVRIFHLQWGEREENIRWWRKGLCTFTFWGPAH